MGVWMRGGGAYEEVVLHIYIKREREKIYIYKYIYTTQDTYTYISIHYKCM